MEEGEYYCPICQHFVSKQHAEQAEQLLAVLDEIDRARVNLDPPNYDPREDQEDV